MTSASTAVHLGFAVPAGTPVEIPIRHMAVTGQTQEAGKTTTLEALIARSQLRALTFVTKRGEGAFTRDILKELERTGTRVNNKSLSIALQDLVVAGFLTKESIDRYRAVPDMKIRVVEAA